MTEQTVLGQLLESFQLEYCGTLVKDHKFHFGLGANIYVRRSDHNVARTPIFWQNPRTLVWDRLLERFPNSDELRQVIIDPAVGVRLRIVDTKVECLFGPHNIDRLIEVLQSGD